MVQDLSFIHCFEQGASPQAPPFLLLHGTGGNENDLLPLGRLISPDSSFLSPRGNVLENGLPRFFRRIAEGVFDQEDVRRRAHELADFVAETRKVYGITAPVALGYSNGANIAAAMMLLRPAVLSGAILLRAMVPLSDLPRSDLTGKPVLILSGAQDPIIPADNASRLALILKSAGANVEHRVLPVRHELSQGDVTIAKSWLDLQKTISVAVGAIPQE
jgi:phospholipase/carboxylesterase